MRMGSAIFGLVVFFALSFYLLGTLVTNNIRFQTEQRELEARVERITDENRHLRNENQDLLSLIDSLKTDNRDLTDRLAYTEKEWQAAKTELAETKNALDIIVESPLNEEFVEGNHPVVDVSPSDNVRDSVKKHEIDEWTIITGLGLAAIMVVSSFAAHHYSKTTRQRPVLKARRPQRNPAERNIVWVRMTRQQCQEYSKWQRNRQPVRD